MKSTDPKPAHTEVADLSVDAQDFSERLTRRTGLSRRLVLLLVTSLTLIAALGITLGIVKYERIDRSSIHATTSLGNTLDARAQAALNAVHARQTTASGVTAFISTNSAISRNAVRSALQDAVSDQAKQKALAAADAQYEASEGDADAPGTDLAASSAAALKEAAQLKAESAAAVALLDQASATSTVEGTTPIAKGSYVLGAHWHETGWWAKWHTGQDFVAVIGTPIHAVADGVVGTPCSGGWAGNNVVIHHANGGSTLYAHMKKTNVKVGQVVKAGDIIGWVGMTGRTFGPHLHFEYYGPGATPGDVYSTSDPIAFLKSLGVTP